MALSVMWPPKRLMALRSLVLVSIRAEDDRMIQALTDRQFREVEYHRGHARKLSALADKPVNNPKRRWWNAYWSVKAIGIIKGWLYGRMQMWIYGTEPYITEDEHKIDEAELAIVLGGLSDIKLAWFYALLGRLFPAGKSHLGWS